MRSRFPRRRTFRRRQVGHVYNGKFTRILVGGLNVPPATDTVLRYSTVLSDFSGATNFVATFRKFKINRVKYTYIPHFNMAQAGISATPGAGVGGYAFTVVDPFGQEAPVMTTEQALNNTRAKRRNFYKPFSVYYKPTTMNITSRDTTITALEAVPVRSSWIDCQNSTDMIHYGHSVLVTNPGSAGGPTMFWDVHATVYVSFMQRDQ